jgi:hypothetical protein
MDTAEELLQYIENSCMLGFNVSGIFQLIHQSMHDQAKACLALEGQHC